MESPKFSRSERADKSIDTFVDEHENLSFKSINIDGKAVVFVHENDLTLPYLTLIKDILKKQAQVEQEGSKLFAECFKIATDSVEDGTSDGVLFADSNADKVTGYWNHAINYKNLEDGTILAVDYTSPLNYDVQRGIYKTFCIHARSKEDLVKYVSELHGGTWNEQSAADLAEMRSHLPSWSKKDK